MVLNLPSRLPLDFNTRETTFSFPPGVRFTAMHAQLERSGQGMQDCFEQFKWIPELVSQFFYQRWADLNMTIRSFSWVLDENEDGFSGRIQAIRHFRSTVEECSPNSNSPSPRLVFHRLSERTRSLLHYVDEAYVFDFENTRDAATEESMRQEILRECDRAICLHNIVSAVNGLFHSLSSGIPDLSSIFSGSPREEEPSSRSYPTPRSPGQTPTTSTGPATLVTIPNTVPYNATMIPPTVVQKGAQIDALKVQLAAMTTPPNIPAYFNCPVTMEPMSIPVFDASHPQAADKTLRHTLDKDSLEGHLATARSYAPAKCPVCRHPENGGMSHLMIDTGVQDEILQFLTLNVH